MDKINLDRGRLTEVDIIAISHYKRLCPEPGEVVRHGDFNNLTIWQSNLEWFLEGIKWASKMMEPECPECQQNKDSGMNFCAFCGRQLWHIE